MDKIRRANKLGRELQEYAELKDSRMVASYWVEKQDRQLDYLNEKDKEMIDLIASIVDLKNIDNSLGIADAFINGKKNIEEVYNYLLNFYTKDELREHYNKNFELFIFKLEEVQAVADYLKTTFEQEDLKSILVKAIVLGIDTCRERNELVLKHFGDKAFLTYLVKNGGLYYPHYYSDIVGGINYIVEELGTEKARKLLEENELFLILYRRAEYRHQYKALFEDAMMLVDKYR